MVGKYFLTFAENGNGLKNQAWSKNFWKFCATIRPEKTFIDHVLEYKLGHGAAADVAVADE